jgi:Fe2+ or Zn2+ uptake regulation protein
MLKAKRSTPLKKKILGLLEENHLLSATQLIEKLHAMGVNANKTSIYRNLDSFLEDNLICQQSFGDELLYELQEDHHDHIRCKSCGKVEETPCPVFTLPQISGYEVDHHHLVMYGMCESCQNS